MAVVAGIDEAGYGPLLGPLAVSATAFRVPDEAAEADLWELLRGAVARGAVRKSDRLRVADSKKLHHGGAGIEPLERNVLPFLAALETQNGKRTTDPSATSSGPSGGTESGVQNAECRMRGAHGAPENAESGGARCPSALAVKSQIRNQKSEIRNRPAPSSCPQCLRDEPAALEAIPENVEAFLRATHTPQTDALSAYPWYRGKEQRLPRAAAPERIALGANCLRDGLARAGAEFCMVRLELLEAAEFSREVTACNNKAQALGRRVAALMRTLWEQFASEGLYLTVDKQGGRNDYEAFLLANFYGCTLTRHCQSAERSRYTLRDGARRMQVTFEPKADSRHLPVALASMFSKYARELMVEMLNEFWRQRVPGLRPTAGYLPDGQRFLEEIEPARRAENIPIELLRRCR